MALNENTRLGASAAGEAYEISRSLKFDSGDSSYLTRTPGSDGNRKTWTFSCWMKRTTVGVLQTFFGAGSNNPDTIIKFNSSDQFEISRYYNIEGGYVNQVTSKAQYRDPSAWYHVVGAIDTTEATASNRVKMYINGEQITVFENDDWPALNFEYEINDASYAQYIGRHPGGQYTSGYIAEFHFIDGQRLTASDFGKTNAATGQWIPIEYTGSYGSQGFYLNFSDNSGATSSTMGDDDSGNGNDWTPNNLATYDSVPDSPTNNFATINPIDTQMLDIFLTQGALKFDSGSNSNTGRGYATIRPSSGKWYAEVWVGQHHRFSIGIQNKYYNSASNTGGANNPNGILVGWDSEAYYNGNTGNNYLGADITSDDIVMIAMDCDNKLVWVGLDGTWGQSVSNTDIANGTSAGSLGTFMSATAATLFQGDMGIFIEDNSGSQKTWNWVNFGQDQGFGPSLSDASVALGNQSDASGYGKFKYPVPAGFNALCTKNLADPTVTDGTKYFNTVTYTGDGQMGRTVGGMAFQPNLVWIKDRDATESHVAFDSIRGGTKRLRVNTSDAEDTMTNTLTAFNSDGFTTNTHDNTNKSGDKYVSWSWKESATAGFDMVSYSGDGQATHNISHNLGVKPDLFIVKSRTNAQDWYVMHPDSGANKYLTLSGNGAQGTSTVLWGNTLPTSSVFTVGETSGWATNEDGEDYIAYLFSSVDGYSKIGTLAGNGNASGPFVYTGFKPAFILYKSYATGESWRVIDNKRLGYNTTAYALFPNVTNVEYTSEPIDLLSNGFKWRNNNGGSNDTNEALIYAAFGERAFKYNNGQ